MRSNLASALVPLFVLAACSHHDSAPPPPLDCSYAGGEGAPSTCLTPKKPADYYVAQSLAYFDTLDTSASRSSVPVYSDLVARGEWPPWLKLTGYTRLVMLDTDSSLLKLTPSTVPQRECRAFAVQPFGRCHVSFEYAQGSCAIYEEFTFNDQGEMTFIEAWSETSTSPGGPADRWAEGPNVHRLSTRIPGLGNATGRIDPNASWMQDQATRDPDVADFVPRAQNFWGAWFAEAADAGGTEMARGCGWD
jgi:hypothetical protein